MSKKLGAFAERADKSLPEPQGTLATCALDKAQRACKHLSFSVPSPPQAYRRTGAPIWAPSGGHAPLPRPGGWCTPPSPQRQGPAFARSSSGSKIAGIRLAATGFTIKRSMIPPAFPAAG